MWSDGPVVFSAGDPSGDLLAAELAAALHAERPGIRLAGVGGLAMAASGVALSHDLVTGGAIGFWEAGRRVWRYRKVLREDLIPLLERERPAAFVPVDFYGFNIHAARAASARGIPVVYFVSPQVWASRPWRVRALKRCVNKMLVLFRFEEEVYRRAGIPVEWVGHPVVDRLAPANGGRAQGPPGGESPPVVGLLPGSRPQEIRRHLPLLLAAARLIAREVPGVGFLMPIASSVDAGMVREACRDPGVSLEITPDPDHRRRAGLSAALAASGTATLELACLGVPMTVFYKTSWLTYMIARTLIHVRHIGMVNLLAGREVVPEFVQARATPERLARSVVAWLRDPREADRVRGELAAVRNLLGEPGAARRAARALLAVTGGNGFPPTTAGMTAEERGGRPGGRPYAGMTTYAGMTA